MKVLVLGASGHIGNILVSRLIAEGVDTVCASRGQKKANIPNSVILDTKDRDSLSEALKGVDAVINCVAGDAVSIAVGAGTLVDAAINSGMPRVIHLSTMSVYGNYEGVATESTPFDPTLGWYAAAKCKAELEIKRYSDAGGTAVILRPGCVYGAGSKLWVGRIGQWLRAGRLGDLGTAGDGWSNMVHVNDVCGAVVSALNLPLNPGENHSYNLAAPDSPRWNEYFTDLARGIGAVPVKRLTAKQLTFDSKIISPPIKVVKIMLSKLGHQDNFLPEPMPPALVRFFGQQIFLDSQQASKELLPEWLSYEEGLRDSIKWFRNS